MPMRISGLASGMDIDSIVERMLQPDRDKITAVKKKKDFSIWKQEAYNTINRTLAQFLQDTRVKLDLTVAGSSVMKSNAIDSFKWVKQAALSNDSVASVSAKTFATEGSYDLEVERLASKVTVASQNKIGAAPVAAKAVTGNSGAIEWTSVPVNASLSTGTGTNEIQWTSKLAGAYGGNVRIELVDPGAANSKLDIQVNTEYKNPPGTPDETITVRVSLATDAGGAATTTANQLIAAIGLDEVASQYVSAQAAGSGAGVVAAAGSTALAGGADRQNVQIVYAAAAMPGDALGITDDLNPTLRTLTVRLADDGFSTVQDVIDIVNRYVNGTEADCDTGDYLTTSDPASLGMLRGTLLGASGQGGVNAGFLLTEPPTDLSASAAGGSGLARGVITTGFTVDVSGSPENVNLNWYMKQVGGTGYTLRIVGQETLGSAQGLKLSVDDQAKEIVVRLATNPSGVVVSTTQDIISKVRADAEISALVHVELADDTDSRIYAGYAITEAGGFSIVTNTGTNTLPAPFTANLAGADYNAATARLGAVNELTWTSLAGGTAGNGVSIGLLAAAANQFLTVNPPTLDPVTGKTQITIDLATDGSGNVITTQAELIALIEADPDLAGLIHIEGTNSAALVESTAPATPIILADGADGASRALGSLKAQFGLLTGDVVRFTIAKASDPSVSHEFIYRGTDLDDKTIEDIVSDINAQSRSLGLGIQAIYDESFNRFYLQTRETGYDIGFTITDNSTTGGINHMNFIAGTRTEAGKQVSDNRLGLLVNSGETKRGENAVFIFEGTRIEDHGTNSVTVNEIDITLKGVGSTTITVSADVDSIVDKVTEFVEQYNIMVTAINALVTEKRISPSKYEKYDPLSAEEKEEMTEDEIKNWETSGKSGILRSDPILERALTNARVAMSAMVQNLPGSYNTLSSVGITTAAYMTGSRGAELTIDEGKLRSAILAEPEGVVQLLFKTAPRVEDLPTVDSVMALSASERAAQLTSLGLDPEMGESAYRAYVTQYNARKRELIYNESGLYYRMSDQLVTSIKEIVRTAGTGAANDEAMLRGIDRSIMSEYVSLYGSVNLLHKEQEQYDNRVTSLTELLLKRETRYYNQFTHMETMLADLNEQFTSLQGALEQMQGLTGGN
jgi:flagellar hook-associated protein 2